MISKHLKYGNENLPSGSIVTNSNRSKKSSCQQNNGVLRDSTNMIANLMEKNNILMDSPIISKEMPQPMIYTNEDTLGPTTTENLVQNYVNNAPINVPQGNSKFNTPAKLNSLANAAKGVRKGNEEDVVCYDHYEQSPYDANMQSRGRTPKKLEKDCAPSSNSKMGSARRSQSDEVPTITPRTKLAQLRAERREETLANNKNPNLEVELNDIKINEMQKELRQIPDMVQTNAAAELSKRGDQMKESLRKFRSLSKSKDKLKDEKSENIIVVQAKTQLQNFKDQLPYKNHSILENTNNSNLDSDKKTKINKIREKNENRAISPLAVTREEREKVSLMMEEKCEKETEQTRAKVSEIESKLTLDKRLIEKMWQVRRNAYIELGKIFKGEIKENPAQTGQYASWMNYILNENNLIALHEGLNTILMFAQNSESVAPAIGLVPDLLDKMPIQRQQFQEIITKILLELVKRDQGAYIVNELLARFGSKKIGKAALFSITCLCSILESELYTEIDLKQVFKISTNILNTHKEIRPQLIKLLQDIYEIIDDSLESFIGHFPETTKNLIVKEITEGLKLCKKRDLPEKIKLFTDSKLLPINILEADKIPAEQNLPTQKKVQSMQKELRKGKSAVNLVQKSIEFINLYECVQDDILKLVYITKAEEKKSKLEEFNSALEGIISNKNKAEKKDYSGIISVLCTLLEDTNIFLQLEVIKTFQLLASLLNKDMQTHKPKQIVSKLLDKLKEYKTAIISQIECTISEFLLKDCINPEALIDTIMQKSISSKNPRVRQTALQILANQKLTNTAILATFSTIIGPKLLTAIQKDSVAGVRDSAINLLTKIKIQCPNSPDVEKIIAKLPKARIQAIYAQVRNETNSSKTPRDTMPPNKAREAFVDLKRSKSEMKINVSKGSGSIIEKPNDAENENIENKIEENSAEGVKNLLQLAENCTYEKFITELQKISISVINDHRPQVLYAIVFLLTRKSSVCFSLPENYAIPLINFLGDLLQNKELTDPELDCALSAAVILSSVIKNDIKQKYRILNILYSAQKIDSFVPSMQKVLYTFKYSDENDSNMTIGMTAYKTLSDWFLAEQQNLKATDLEKLSSLLNINSTMGFKREFVIQMEKVRQQLINRNEKNEVQEAIANASAVAMSLKAPTPRTRLGSGMQTPKHVSKNQEKLKEILEQISNKEAFKNKKGIEALNMFLDDIIKGKTDGPAGQLFASYLILSDLIENLCKLISKAQWLEDDVLTILTKLRGMISNEESQKLIRILMQNLADYMQIDNKSEKYLTYYITLNSWAKEMCKKEITSLISDIFSGCSFRYDSTGNEAGSRSLQQLKTLLSWLSTQILGEFFKPTDIEPILTYIIKGLKCNPGLRSVCENILKQCYKVFGIKKAQQWLEEALAQAQTLYKIYAEWHDSYFKIANKTETSANNKSDKKQNSTAVTGSHPTLIQRNLMRSPIPQQMNSQPPMNNSLMALNEEIKKIENNSLIQTPKETPIKLNLSTNGKNDEKNLITEENEQIKPHLQSSLMKQPLTNYIENSPTFKDSEGPKEKPEIKQQNLIEKPPKSQIAYHHSSEKARKNSSNPPSGSKMNTVPNVLQQITSPRFGSQLGYAPKNELPDKKSEDTPLSLQELDSEEAVHKAAAIAEFSEIMAPSEPIAPELLEKLPENIFKLQTILLDAISPPGAISELLCRAFNKKTTLEQRLEFSKGLSKLLESEDILQSIPILNLHNLLDGCIKICVNEKVRVTSNIQNANIKDIVGACNNVISELQNCLTKIVNSHSFTIILCMFVALIKRNLPENFSLELSKEQIVYIRLLMICLQKTFKASQDQQDLKNSVSSNGIRVFALLIELNKLFTVHPPEKLKQNLPSLPVFDYVYKILREITDVIVEMDTDKTINFITWAEQDKENMGTFIKYVKNVLARVIKKSEETKS